MGRSTRRQLDGSMIMPLLSKLIIPLCTVLLSACVSWPREGEGGFAEYHRDNLISVEASHKVLAKHGLRFDYTLAKNQLSLLKLQGAQYCFPASIDNAEQLENRIIRELSAGMYESASVNIIKQRLALDTLERKLSIVISQSHCIPPNRAEPPSLYNTLLTQLNSDNQFATNSSELNQKYKNNLDYASKTLKRLTHLKILIIGSTDQVGNEIKNISLSQHRAKEVRDYLVKNGVDVKNIDIIASGENAPLYEGDSGATRLINRNVRIYLFES